MGWWLIQASSNHSSLEEQRGVVILGQMMCMASITISMTSIIISIRLKHPLSAFFLLLLVLHALWSLKNGTVMSVRTSC